jgi:hypothetical protein
MNNPNHTEEPTLTIVIGPCALEYIKANNMTRSLLNKDNKYLSSFLSFLRKKDISACIAFTNKKDEQDLSIVMRFLADKIVITHKTDIFPHWKYRVYKDRTNKPCH